MTETTDAMSDHVRVTLTGTGTPVPKPGRAGAGTLVRIGDVALQFDAGRSTSLRLIEAGVRTPDLSALFLTHHHSDHCVDVPDLIIGRWIQRGTPLTVIAPDGPLTAFGAHVLDLWAEDIAVRRSVTGRDEVRCTWQPFTATEAGGVVWESGPVRVTGFLVDHAPVEHAVGYRIDAYDRSVVISGDTRICAPVEAMADGADVLVHEVSLPEHIRRHADPKIIDYHTGAEELGALAARAGVGTLMLTHLQPVPDTPEIVTAYEEAVAAGGFRGRVLVGHDLLTYDLTSGDVVDATPPA